MNQKLLKLLLHLEIIKSWRKLNDNEYIIEFHTNEEKQRFVNKKHYNICDQCGNTAEEVDWEEYKKIKRKFNL